MAKTAYQIKKSLGVQNGLKSKADKNGKTKVKTAEEIKAGVKSGKYDFSQAKKALEKTINFEKNEAVLKTVVLKGYLAVVFGHEFDHLNGILFVDRVNKENPFFVPENSKPIKFKE